MADNIAIVQQAYESFLRGDVRGVVDLLDPEIVWIVPRMVPHGGVFRGIDGVREFFDGVGAAWKPLALDLETVGEIGPGQVAGMAKVSGILAGEDVSYRCIHVFTVDNGKITCFREFLDLDAALAG
jgi:ketosteroid isomerase-like protein